MATGVGVMISWVRLAVEKASWLLIKTPNIMIKTINKPTEPKVI